MTFGSKTRGASAVASSLAELDGMALAGDRTLVPLADDGAIHRLQVRLG